MGNTRNTGYLQNLVVYDASGNIVLPANLTVTGTITGYATQSYVTTQINNLINGAPGLLDTLDELAAALGDDANFASTITTSIAGRQAALNGTGFVKVSGTTVSYDNSTYALDSVVVKLTGSQSIAGVKTFTDRISVGATSSLSSYNANFGTLHLQSYLVNNAWFGDNVYYNGSNFIRVATGFTGAFYFQGPEGQFRFGASGAAGTSVGNGTVTLKTNLDGSFAVGNLSTATSNYTGYTFYIAGSTGAATFTGPLVGTSATFRVSSDRNLAIKYDTNITLSAQADAGGPESLRIFADTFRIFTATSAAGLTERFTISNAGAATFSSSVTAYGSVTVINGIYTLPALTPSYFGYSGYGVLIVGNSNSAQTRSIAFNVDVSGNPSGAFNGYGSEYIWRNAGSFITPNSINNGYNTLLSWNSSGQMTFNQAAIFSNTVSASILRSLNSGVDAIYQDAFVGVYSSNNNEQNAIQTSVSSIAASSGFRFQVSNGGGSSARTTMMTLTRSNLSVSNEVIVGAQGGTDTTYISGGSGYGSVIRNIYAGGSINNELRGNGNNYFNVLLGSMGVGTNNPQYTLDVNGSGRFVGALYANNTIYGTRIIGGNLIAGNMASNMPTSPSYILIVNINDIAGFSMSGKVNAASYTCWNISDIWIEKDYSSTVVRAGIEGKYKSGCDFSIVDISYGAGRYVAFRFTSNPEVDVLLTGYRLTDQVSGGSFQVITSGVTVNGTYASY